MISTPNTPGFNCRLAVFFSHDRKGRKMAFRWSWMQLRAFRMNLADAEMFVAQDLVDLLEGHPLKAR